MKKRKKNEPKKKRRRKKEEYVQKKKSNTKISDLILKFTRSCGHHSSKRFNPPSHYHCIYFFHFFFLFLSIIFIAVALSPNKLKSISFVIMHITCYIDIIHTYDRFSSRKPHLSLTLSALHLTLHPLVRWLILLHVATFFLYVCIYYWLFRSCRPLQKKFFSITLFTGSKIR